MIKYYKVIVDETSKSMGNNNEDYKCFDRITENFKTIKEVKEWLQEKYKNCKKTKCFRDNKNNKSYQSGCIYHFKNQDISHNSSWWYQQDWIEVREVKEKIVLL